MKPVDVKSSTYTDFNKENNKEVPKFKLGDNVSEYNIRISEYKNIFAKAYTPNWPEQVFVIKKVKILFHGHMLLVKLTFKKLLEHFLEKNCKKTNKKVYSRKSNKKKRE